MEDQVRRQWKMENGSKQSRVNTGDLVPGTLALGTFTATIPW